MDEKFPFFLQIESIQDVRANDATRSLYVECIGASAADRLYQVDISLSRPAAEALYQRIGPWLAGTAAGEPPKQ
ncbi:MAG: hypothetical protein A3F74_19585 [Betaproteobacteria bacterium RIFCSPLOWO2_12_FULL_62_58]|nr:MAG: hypothetical protein A3F74_19585 [Betaproteobacteria bacterium RIFCSPLOWO2_12_FULL_62_58]